MKGMNIHELQAFEKAIRENENLRYEIERLKAEIEELRKKLGENTKQA